MKIRYDSKIDAIYIKLAKGTYEVSREVSDSVIVDEDKYGKVLGIEILDAKKLQTLTQGLSSFGTIKLLFIEFIKATFAG